MDWKDNIVECNVWCYEEGSDEQEKLGLEPKGVWLPMIMDLSSAVMVKSAGLSEKFPELNNVGIVYVFSIDGFVTDIPYEKLKLMFEMVKKNMLSMKKEK